MIRKKTLTPGEVPIGSSLIPHPAVVKPSADEAVLPTVRRMQAAAPVGAVQRAPLRRSTATLAPVEEESSEDSVVELSSDEVSSDDSSDALEGLRERVEAARAAGVGRKGRMPAPYPSHVSADVVQAAKDAAVFQATLLHEDAEARRAGSLV